VLNRLIANKSVELPWGLEASLGGLRAEPQITAMQPSPRSGARSAGTLQ
jgi:hypothetical protein